MQSQHFAPDAYETALMRRLAQGCPEALGELYSRHSADVKERLCRRFGKDNLGELGIEMEDLLQGIWQHVPKQARSYQPTGAVGAWLFACARNYTIDLIRSCKARRRRDDSYAVALEAELEGGRGYSASELAGCEDEYRTTVLSTGRTGRGWLTRLNRWIHGIGQDSVRGMLACFGMVALPEKYFKRDANNSKMSSVVSVSNSTPTHPAIIKARCSLCGKRRTCSLYGVHHLCGSCERSELPRLVRLTKLIDARAAPRMPRAAP